MSNGKIPYKICKSFQRAFIEGSTNYKSSAASEQEKTDCKSSQEDYENQLAGVSRKYNIIKKVSENSTLKRGFNTISTSERQRESLEKLFDIAYLHTKKGRPYSDFSELFSLQKMHEVKLSIS